MVLLFCAVPRAYIEIIKGVCTIFYFNIVYTSVLYGEVVGGQLNTNHLEIAL